MSEDNNPKRTAKREAMQRRKLVPGAACVGCGESDPKLLELHHVAGRAHERELVTPLCKNCHARATEAQLRGDIPFNRTQNLLDRIVAIFQTVAAFFRFLADSCERIAGELVAFVASLDLGCPNWRELTAMGA